jgi:exonuclease VII small subunit
VDAFCQELGKKQVITEVLFARLESENAFLRSEVPRLRGLCQEELASRNLELRELVSRSERLENDYRGFDTRISTMETLVSTIESKNEAVRNDVGQRFESHEERLKALWSDVAKLKLSRSALEEFESYEERFEGLCSQVAELRTRSAALEEGQSALSSAVKLAAVSPAALQKPQTKIDCPIQKGKPLDGVISHLTKESGGKVHDNGIVTITSKSVSSDHPECSSGKCADVTGGSEFESEDEAGQWICWDFHGKRVNVSHYTLCTQ